MKDISKMRYFIVAILTLTMCFAVAGCGEKDIPSEDVQPTTETEEPQTEVISPSDSTYDILYVVEEAGLRQTLPADIDYSTEQLNNTSISVCLDACRGDGLEGRVGTIMAFEEGDEEYLEFPDYMLCGKKDGIQYVILFPTDLQYDPSDSKQQEDFDRLTEALKTFEIK